VVRLGDSSNLPVPVNIDLVSWRTSCGRGFMSVSYILLIAAKVTKYLHSPLLTDLQSVAK